MSIAVVAIGFALVLLRSMIDRGYARRFNDEISIDSNDWSYELKSGGLGRLLRFLAGIPCFVVLAYIAIDHFGWWGLALFPAGVVLAFALSVMLGVMAGANQNDRDRYSRGIRRLGSIMPPLVIAWVVVLTPVILGIAERGSD